MAHSLLYVGSLDYNNACIILFNICLLYYFYYVNSIKKKKINQYICLNTVSSLNSKIKM